MLEVRQKEANTTQIIQTQYWDKTKGATQTAPVRNWWLARWLGTITGIFPL